LEAPVAVPYRLAVPGDVEDLPRLHVVAISISRITWFLRDADATLAGRPAEWPRSAGWRAAHGGSR
jgi:hypothetical protein